MNDEPIDISIKPTQIKALRRLVWDEISRLTREGRMPESSDELPRLYVYLSYILDLSRVINPEEAK